MFCGGRGRHSIRTPDELRAFSLKTGLDGDALARTSRLTARVDNNAIADGFQLYLHSFAITKSGEWAVVQQGMNPENHLARDVYKRQALSPGASHGRQHPLVSADHPASLHRGPVDRDPAQAVPAQALRRISRPAVGHPARVESLLTRLRGASACR